MTTGDGRTGAPPREGAGPPANLPTAVVDFLTAVDARDAAAVAASFDTDAAYHVAVPHPPVRGRTAIEALFTRIFTEAERVRWEVRSWSGDEYRIFLERVDRFWYGGHEAVAECCGVVELAGGLIVEIRDYVDLPTWKERKATARRTPPDHHPDPSHRKDPAP